MKLFSLLALILIISTVVYCQESDVELKIEEEEQKIRQTLDEDAELFLQKFGDDVISLVRFAKASEGDVEEDAVEIEAKVEAFEKDAEDVLENESSDFVRRRIEHHRAAARRPAYKSPRKWANTIGRIGGAVTKDLGPAILNFAGKVIGAVGAAAAA